MKLYLFILYDASLISWITTEFKQKQHLQKWQKYSMFTGRMVSDSLIKFSETLVVDKTCTHAIFALIEIKLFLVRISFTQIVKKWLSKIK